MLSAVVVRAKRYGYAFGTPCVAVRTVKGEPCSQGPCWTAATG